MAKISSQKFIARNRAPRVVIEYSMEAYGVKQRCQIPFVIGVLADLAGKPSGTPPSLEERRMKEIDLDNFESCMQELKPRTMFSVPDTIRGEGELAADLTFESMDDFLPGSLARMIAGPDKLLEIRTQLNNLVVYMDGKSGAESFVERVLNDEGLRCEAASMLEAASENAAPSESAPDSFAELLRKAFNPKTQQALVQVGAALRTLAEHARGYAGQDPATIIAAIIANLDRQLERQINLILQHPDYRQLEAAWRGLHYLVSNIETSESLKIRFMSLSKAELGKMIRRYGGAAWDQSPLFKKIYEEPYGQSGGEPYGCLIGDYEFAHEPKEIEILTGMAQIAAAAHAPFLAAASPALMRMDQWQELANPRDLSRVFSTPDYSAWRALRESEDSRYIALTIPRFLARLPYGSQTDAVEEFEFEESVRGADTSCFVWANSAYALAANIARAFALYGWCARIRGFESGGLVENLPSHVFPSDDGGMGRSPTEISISDRWESELARMGLMPLVWRKNYDSAVFIGAQSLHKPAQYDEPEVTAGAALAARLPYVLASCRFVHYLKCIIRDGSGSFTRRDHMERWLNDWISQYVDHDPANSSEEGKARKPLADAQIVLEPIEGNPAAYRGKLYVRPHYQLEGLTTSIRVIFKIPSQRPA